MVDLLYGTGMWIAVCLAISGIIFRCIKLFGISHLQTRTDAFADMTMSTRKFSIAGGNTFFQRLYLVLHDSVVMQYPVFIIITILFHILVIVLPLCIKGHTVLFFQSWQVPLCYLSEPTADILTIIIIALLCILILRRIGLPYVKVLTTWKDISILLLSSVPFITGFMAYHQFGNYTIIITVHILSGQALLVSLGWGKMGHMIFMIFSRLSIRNEYAYQRASRVWGR